MKHGYTAGQCVFLDMEIFRRGVRSIGQHMLLYNRAQPPSNWANFDTCLSINNLRGHDAYASRFRLKYPFATIHFLLPVVSKVKPVEIATSAITPLLFTDGTWMNLLGYTENSLSWLRYLRAGDNDNPLRPVFLNQELSLYSLMEGMDDFLRQRHAISVPRERGDRIAVTLRGGEGTPHNLAREAGLYTLRADARARGERFLSLLATSTRWEYRPASWTWGGWDLYQFEKQDFASEGVRLNNSTYNVMVLKSPLSLAITSTANVEYTLERPDQMPL
jgi:hypothetical protein